MKNKICYLFFSGYYVTSLASEILVKNNIENRIVKSPVMIRNGCNFTLRIKNDDAEISIYLLEREGIRLVKKVVSEDKI